MAARRILVTGASGFVGMHLLSAIREEFPDSEVYAVGDKTVPNVPGCIGLRASMLDDEDLKRLATLHPSTVVHLAARSSVADGYRSGADTIRVNLVGTLRFADCFAEVNPGAAFVFPSSGEVYGGSFGSDALNEDAALQPRGSYSCSKVASEWGLAELLRGRCKLTILRLFNHTGVGQSAKFVVPSFAKQIAEIEQGLVAPVVQVGNLKAVRDFLSVGDVVRAYVRVLGDDDNQPVTNTYNISSGRGRSIESILDELVLMARKPVRIQQDAERMRPSDIPIAIGNSSRFRERYSWQPTDDFSKVLAGILEDFRAQMGKH